jgi:hypothetical protein
MSTHEFLSLGHIAWIECHWTVSQTQEGAKRWFKNKGYVGQVYKMIYPTSSKNSDGFFAWWMPIR